MAIEDVRRTMAPSDRRQYVVLADAFVPRLTTAPNEFWSAKFVFAQRCPTRLGGDLRSSRRLQDLLSCLGGTVNDEQVSAHLDRPRVDPLGRMDAIGAPVGGRMVTTASRWRSLL